MNAVWLPPCNTIIAIVVRPVLFRRNIGGQQQKYDHVPLSSLTSSNVIPSVCVRVFAYERASSNSERRLFDADKHACVLCVCVCVNTSPYVVHVPAVTVYIQSRACLCLANCTYTHTHTHREQRFNPSDCTTIVAQMAFKFKKQPMRLMLIGPTTTVRCRWWHTCTHARGERCARTHTHAVRSVQRLGRVRDDRDGKRCACARRVRVLACARRMPRESHRVSACVFRVF